MTSRLYVLGNGEAHATKCYNTCFLVDDGVPVLLDTGGGNQTLVNLEKLGIPLERIHTIFLSHDHIDHILGMFWMIRLISSHMMQGRYEGDLTILCQEESKRKILAIGEMLLGGKKRHFCIERIRFVTVSGLAERGGETVEINGHQCTVFSTYSDKVDQIGVLFSTRDGKRICYLGDEPYVPRQKCYAEQADYLLLEAICLAGALPREKLLQMNHSTVREAATSAQSLGVPNLVLIHGEDQEIETRKARYTAEAETVYSGKIYVPDDLDVIDLV